MNEADRICLQHMRDAAHEVQSFAEGKSRESLDEDRGLTLIFLQLITIIGEAASKVSEEGCAEHPEIPWVLIAGMRNRLVHGYYDVNLDTVWNTVEHRIPELITQIEPILRAAE